MEEALIRRTLPHSIEAERAVIGSMLMDPEAIESAAGIVQADDFYGNQYKILFQTIYEMYSNGKPVDLLTLQTQLGTMDVPQDLAGIDFIRGLLDAVPTSANVRYYAKIVKDKSKLRGMIKLNEEIENACYAAKEDVSAIMEDAEKKLFEVMQQKDTSDFVPIRQVVINAMEQIEAASKVNGTVTGIPTGFYDLDFKTSGFQNSDLILVAARPAMGKTAFVLNIASHMAFKKNVTVAIFSLEMSKEQLINRMFSLESGVEAQKLRTGDLEDSDWERLIESANVIGNSNLIIEDKSGITISELRSKCRKYKLEHNLGIIIIDYLQLMSGDGRRGRQENRQQEISDISRSLKNLARELNVPVVALSQLSRAVEQRPDHRPMLSDLRESGAIEQDADIVMFLYRDDYYHPDTEKKGIAEVIIAKQRSGAIGTVELVWLSQFTKFANYAPEKNKN